MVMQAREGVGYRYAVLPANGPENLYAWRRGARGRSAVGLRCDGNDIFDALVELYNYHRRKMG